MEDSSHELIDQMIAEEQYCYGFDAAPQVTSVGAVGSSQTQRQQLPVSKIGDVSRADSSQITTDIIFENSKERKPKKGKAENYSCNVS